MGELKLFSTSDGPQGRSSVKGGEVKPFVSPTPFAAREPFVHFKKQSLSWKNCMEAPRLSLGIILATMGVFFVWINIAEIDRVVRVEGRVIPAGRNQQIQHLEGGIVAAISTHEGAYVKKDDLLLTIDGTTAGVNLNEAKVKLLTQRLRAARLESEATGSKDVSFPKDISETSAINAEMNLFLSRKEKLQKELQIHQELMRQHTAELKETENKRANLSEELAIARKRTKMVESMVAKQAASQIELMDAQSRERRLETEIAYASDSQPRLTAAIAQEQAKYAATQADFRSEAQKELVSVLAEVNNLSQANVAAADRVKRTEIRAPLDGVVNRISVNTVGGVVRSGDVLVEITPNTNEIMIEAKANPKDRGDLTPDQPVKVRVSAFDTGALGTLSGAVTEISADTMQETRGDAFYRVKILVPSIKDTPYENKSILPGMTITGDIVTGRRTIFSYLVSPYTKFTNTMFRDPR